MAPNSHTAFGQIFALSRAKMSANNELCVGQPPWIFSSRTLMLSDQALHKQKVSQDFENVVWSIFNSQKQLWNRVYFINSLQGRTFKFCLGQHVLDRLNCFGPTGCIQAVRTLEEL